ncbi:DUF2019 domain-containing protein [Reyranella sp.]|uniref:DUF2019 domain-containing protein n=1 Tax=Reyranella sp. TaxID=1929291 RepID=UPI003D0CBF76
MSDNNFSNIGVLLAASTTQREEVKMRRLRVTDPNLSAAWRRKASLEALLEAYGSAAKKHHAANLVGDWRTGNPQATIVFAIYRELRRRGLEAQRALLSLLDEEDLGIRLWTAAHALEFDPDRGIPILEELAKTAPWPENFNAGMTLKLWKKGELSFP